MSNYSGRAADLSEGSIVAAPRLAWIKTEDGWWYATGISGTARFPSEEIDEYLGSGAQVLRYGAGERP